MNKIENLILEVLHKENKAFSALEICRILNFNTKDDLKAIIQVLHEMEKNFKVYVTKSGNYMLFENSNCQIGILQTTTKGFGFVRVDDNLEIKIPSDKIHDAINKDKVMVNITNNKSEPIEGEIVRVVERSKDNIVGTVFIRKGKIFVKPDDTKLNFDVEILDNDYANLVEGHKVVISLLTGIKGNHLGNIVKVIGHINDPGIDILSIMAKYDVNDEFSEALMEEVHTLPDHVLDEEIKRRADL